ncbi:MAG: penicillin-binding transpeptidase domain-containing protein, partial [Myxococcota bacterium]
LTLTVDARLEDELRRIMQEEAPKIYSRGARSAAVVVIDVASGEVRAAVGSTFEDNPVWGEFSAVTAERQPGSALKPFLYGEALAAGDTAASLAADIERPFPDTWGIYKPRNYDERYHGPVRYRAALAQSLNVAAVDLLTRVGLERFYRTLERAGISTLSRRPSHYGLGLVLGSAPVRLVDLTNAYAALARDGEWRPWTVLANRAPSSEPRQLFDRRVAFVLADMLADGNARAEQFGMRSVLTTPYWSASKTGTSKGYRDNWTLGFTGEVAVGVWVGDPTGKPMHRVSGVEGAGSIWRRAMNLLTEGRSRAPSPPPGLEQVRVCSVSGAPMGPHCDGGLDEWFIKGTAPTAPCPYHRHERVDPDDGGLVPAECTVPAAVWETVTVYPSPYDAWAEASGVGRSERVSEKCEAKTDRGATVELLSPAPQESVSLDSDTPLENQALTFKARVTGSTAPVTYWIDGAPVSTVPPPYEWTWPVRPGVHAV